MKDLMPTGQVETYEAKVTPSVALPYGLENPPSVERDSGGGLGLSEWRKIQVKDLGEIVTGNTPSTRRRDYYDGDYNLISPADLDNGKYIRTAHKRLTKLGFEQCRALPKRSVLVGCIGNVGKLGMVGNDESATNQQINALICNSEHDPEFVYYCFYINREKLKTCAVKTTVPILNKTNFSNFEVNVPPLPEQKKIAHILSTVQRAIETQDRIIQTTTELKKALMHKLFTEGLRNEPQKQTEIGLVPKSWEVIELGDMLKLAQYGLSVKGNDEGNYPILRMTNQVNGQIVDRNLQYVEISDADYAKFKVERGDILFNRTNSLDLVGRTAIFDIGGDFVFASYLIRLQTDEKHLNPFFLNCYFNTDEIQARLKSIATRAVSQSNISASRLKGFPIPKPSSDEQEEMVTASLALDRKLAVHQAKLEQLQALFHILLHELMTAKTRVQNPDAQES